MQTSESQQLEPPVVEESRQVPHPAGGEGGLIQVSEEVVQRIIVQVLEDLKSERVQVEAADGEITAQLKSERVQLMLEAMPAWKQEGQSIFRVRAFPTPEAAGIFCGLVATMAGASSLPVLLHLSGSNVKVALHARRSRGRIGAITEDVVNLAAAIG